MVPNTSLHYILMSLWLLSIGAAIKYHLHVALTRPPLALYSVPIITIIVIVCACFVAIVAARSSWTLMPGLLGELYLDTNNIDVYPTANILFCLHPTYYCFIHTFGPTVRDAAYPILYETFIVTRWTLFSNFYHLSRIYENTSQYGDNCILVSTIHIETSRSKRTRV